MYVAPPKQQAQAGPKKEEKTKIIQKKKKTRKILNMCLRFVYLLFGIYLSFLFLVFPSLLAPTKQ